MNLAKTFKRLDRKMVAFVDCYTGEIDIAKLVDCSRLSDNPHELGKENLRQASLYAYWGSLHTISTNQYDELVRKRDMFKAGKIAKIVELLKQDGISHPTIKAVDQRFEHHYKNHEIWSKYLDQVEKWKVRRDNTALMMKVMNSRSEQIKNQIYLLTGMMNHGMANLPRKKTRKPVK